MNKKIPIAGAVIFYLICSGMFFLMLRSDYGSGKNIEITPGMIIKSLVFGLCPFIYPITMQIRKRWFTKPEA